MLCEITGWSDLWLDRSLIIAGLFCLNIGSFPGDDMKYLLGEKRGERREGCFNWTVSRMILIELRWLAPGNWIRPSELASHWSAGRTLCSHWSECFQYSFSAAEGRILTNLLRWFLISHHQPAVNGMLSVHTQFSTQHQSYSGGQR